MPVAEHHDGFAMYDSKLTEWNAVKMGPRRDLTGELADAVRAEGLIFGVSYHRAENWFFFDGGRSFPSDVQDDRNRGLYGYALPKPADQGDPHAPEWPPAAHLDEWLERACEIVDRYHPQVFWFDWWIQHDSFKPFLPRFAAYYYNAAREWGPDWDQSGAAINHKFDAFPEGTSVFDIERGQLAGHPAILLADRYVGLEEFLGLCPQPGLQDRRLDHRRSGGYRQQKRRAAAQHRAAAGWHDPRAGASHAARDRPAGWRSTAQAIYSTRPWKIFGEGPTEVSEGAFTDTKRQSFTSQDIRFTTSGDTLYAIALAWPDQAWTIKSLGTASAQAPGRIASVELLGSAARAELVAGSGWPDGHSAGRAAVRARLHAEDHVRRTRDWD